MESPPFLMIRSFPKAILHVDGDSFFASCEIAKDPSLRGRPVVTGGERGIASAMSYEAKARGVTRGMKLSDVRRVCPEAVIIVSDYETYELYASRMYSIVRRFTPAVEEYSIDECFADLTGLRRFHGMSYEKIALRIKHTLESELGITFSVGLAPTKVLAKVASKWQKPDGFTVIPGNKIYRYLQKLPISKVWGIGPQTAFFLHKYGIGTAYDFVEKNEAWVTEFLSKPFYEIWRELRGEMIYSLAVNPKETYQSISKTNTFSPPSRDRNFIFSELSKNVEGACDKARRHGLVTQNISFFIKTQSFQYKSAEVNLSRPVFIPQEILRAISGTFEKLFFAEKSSSTLYRATGVTLLKLQENKNSQPDLFGDSVKTEAIAELFKTVDSISNRFGNRTVFLASSLSSIKRRNSKDKPIRLLFKGELSEKRLNIPMLGEAH